jgi:hypothetical protein
MTPSQAHALRVAQIPVERRHAVVLARRFAPPSAAHVRALDIEHALPGRAQLLAEMRKVLERRRATSGQVTRPFAYGRRLS